jgi:hypothetical protein
MVYSTQSEPVRNEQVTVGTSSILIAEQRVQPNKRKVFVVRNISADPLAIITVNMGYLSAVANTGIVLKQNESFTEATDAGYECYQDQISAVCTIAGGILAIFER